MGSSPRASQARKAKKKKKVEILWPFGGEIDGSDGELTRKRKGSQKGKNKKEKKEKKFKFERGKKKERLSVPFASPTPSSRGWMIGPTIEPHPSCNESVCVVQGAHGFGLDLDDSRAFLRGSVQ
ncbi:hypothetical protein PDE_03024 [Penicillium oxalicum 114-2]|uniref:Uncharacterized protein n=1 Tax=Penicillium oxalicum (strain 114-2 / CGMCC 5302) TaxID=933388 RepID=S8AQ53_PENO1|nr:hypothetical protein PDE_03024 [Penicillium oxalicum 114-2]